MVSWRSQAMNRTFHRLKTDPRHYQIGVLAFLLLYGITALNLPVSLDRVGLILGTALLTQWICTRVWKLPAFDPRSPLISGLSLCLLLRTQSPTLAIAGAIIAIASKFAIRRGGKHVFNPTNLALVVLILLTDRAWVSPGQWGSAAYLGFAIAGLGGLVVYRAERSDVTYAFLASYAAILFGRALWLGDPWTIPLHQLQSGALLLFAFYMISDPRTTPDSRPGRFVYAALVATGAGIVHFALFKPNGLLWSLVCCAPLVPVIDRLLPGKQYRWPGASGGTADSAPPRKVAPDPTPPISLPNPVPAFIAHGFALIRRTIPSRKEKLAM
ncbi:MAG: RnfABCDGE type electron transport complex subunit D, partial [Candidatus Eisenbacteria bacterium]|nr:RnfABCDGE type electron transport complex subunit D [Candidatus Eisenbacteria bacterium]